MWIEAKTTCCLYSFSYIVVEPEPEPVKKAPAPGCFCLAWGYCGGKVVTILVKFSHISTIYTQIERKNRYT